MRMFWLVVLAFVGGTASGAAQAVTEFADLPLRLNLGDEVTVDARDGDSFAGRVGRLTPDLIAVTGPDARERVFTATDVQRVRRRGDGLVNGVRIGAIVGGAVGAVLAGLFSGEFRAGDSVQGLLIFGAAGAGLGLAVDALHTGSTTVFRAPAASTRWWPPRRGVAVGATVSWSARRPPTHP